MNGYQNLELGSKDYFKESYNILEEEINKEIRKQLKQTAQMFVSDFGQMPYGSSVAGQITGDIYKGGQEQLRRGGVEIGLGAALPQYQAGVNWQQLIQGQKFAAEESELDRAFRKEMAKWGYDWATMQAEANKPNFWDFLGGIFGGIGTGVGYGIGKDINL
jgi:hypothetical protein